MREQGLPAIHPGEFLAETLQELGISQGRFARHRCEAGGRYGVGCRIATIEPIGGTRDIRRPTAAGAAGGESPHDVIYSSTDELIDRNGVSIPDG